MADPKKPALISLFAGAGGLDLGLELAGFSCVAANEVESHSVETLRANQAIGTMDSSQFSSWFEQVLTQRCYRSLSEEGRGALFERLERARGTQGVLPNAAVIHADVREVESEQLAEASGVAPGDLTLVAGGPPCQPFSRAGKRNTVDDARNGQLFLEFVRVVKDLRPRWFLFENVKGLAQTKTSVWFRCCLSCGVRSYPPFDPARKPPVRGTSGGTCPCGSQQTTWEVVDQTPGGSLELILAEFDRLGYLCDSRVLNAADYGVPQTRERLFIVGSRDGERFEWPARTHIEPLSARDRTLFDGQLGVSPWRTIYETLWANGHPEFGELDLDRALLWVKNVVRPHDEPVTWPLQQAAPTVGAHQAAKFALTPKGVPPAQLRRQQWHTLGRRQGDTPPVPVQHAYLSDEELLKLQTFPDSWYLHGTRMQRAFQIGNAVPPQLAYVVGNAILHGGTETSVETDDRFALSEVE